MSSKAPGIRETIKILLTLLTDCGCPHVPSESFRQAKFNKTEAVEPFWMILQHTVCVDQFLKSGDLRDIRECLTTSACHNSPRNRKKAVIQVKTYALGMGYSRLEFYDDATSSCEQLLFFAWLLQSTSLSSQLVSYHVNAALNSLSIPLASSKHFLLERIEKDTLCFHREIQNICDSLATLPLDDVLRKTQWMKGTLQGNCRSVENAHKASAKLSHSLLQSCSDSASQRHQRLHPVSLHDLFLLRYPDQLAVCVKSLEWHIACLHNLLKWQQQEPVFWQWMESVLDRHIVDSSYREEGIDVNSDAKKVPNDTSTLRDKVAQCQQRLSDLVAIKQPQNERLYKTSSASATKCKSPSEDYKVGDHTTLHQVAGMWCPVLAPQSCSAPPQTSLQCRTLEHETLRLQASIEKMQEQLDTHKSAISAYI